MTNLVELQNEIRRLEQLLAAQGELLEQERIERKAEIDRLRISFAALKAIVARIAPEEMARFDSEYERESRIYDPELDRRAA